MIDRETIALCTDRAQKLDRHHYLAREIFVEQMLDELTDLVMGLDAQMLRDVEEGFEDEVRRVRSEEHTSELQSRGHLVCRLLLEKKKGRQKVRLHEQSRDCRV